MRPRTAHRSARGSHQFDRGASPRRRRSARRRHVPRDGPTTHQLPRQPDPRLDPLFVHDGGRNAFEGYRTRRLYSPIDETDVLDPIVEHPLALGLLDELFEPNYLLSQLQVIDIAPGEAAQGLHPDDLFYPWPRPRPALGASTIFAIDDFTAYNGATVVIAGSHRWDDHFPTDDEAARSSEHIQRLLGYSIDPPFIGFVRGMHPKRLFEDLNSAQDRSTPSHG